MSRRRAPRDALERARFYLGLALDAADELGHLDLVRFVGVVEGRVSHLDLRLRHLDADQKAVWLERAKRQVDDLEDFEAASRIGDAARALGDHVIDGPENEEAAE